MGMDTVELVMDVEEHFGVSIPDDEASKLETLGDLHAWLVQALNAKHGTSRNAERWVFFELYKAFDNVVGQPLKRWRPSTPMCDVMSKLRLRRVWREVQKHHQWQLPELQRPSWVVLLNILLGIVSGMLFAPLLFDGLWNEKSIGRVVFIMFVGMVLTWFFLTWLTRPLCVEPSAKNLRLLTYDVMMLNGKLLDERFGPPTEKEVWSRLVGVVGHYAVIYSSGLRPQHRIVADLGLD